MYEFSCGSPVCTTHFTAESKDEVMAEVAKHVHKKHRIANPSKSLVQFIEANTVRQVPAGKAQRS